MYLLFAALFVLLVSPASAQTVDFSFDVRDVSPRMRVLGVPTMIDTDHDPATNEWLIHFQDVPAAVEDQRASDYYAFRIFAVRATGLCPGPEFAHSQTEDAARVQGQQLLVREGDRLTAYRLHTPVCQ